MDHLFRESLYRVYGRALKTEPDGIRGKVALGRAYRVAALRLVPIPIYRISRGVESIFPFRHVRVRCGRDVRRSSVLFFCQEYLSSSRFHHLSVCCIYRIVSAMPYTNFCNAMGRTLLSYR